MKNVIKKLLCSFIVLACMLLPITTTSHAIKYADSGFDNTYNGGGSSYDNQEDFSSGTIMEGIDNFIKSAENRATFNTSYTDSSYSSTNKLNTNNQEDNDESKELSSAIKILIIVVTILAIAIIVLTIMVTIIALKKKKE